MTRSKNEKEGKAKDGDWEIVQVDFIPTEHRGLSEEDRKVDELSKPLTTKDKKRQLKGVVFLHIFVPSKVVIKQQPADRGAFAMFFEKYLLHL